MTKEIEKQNEEQRKLQVTGGSTFILSLPKEWAIRNELKRGSSMVVREEDDGSLSIAPSKFVKKEKQDEAFIKASVNENPDAVMRTAISAYVILCFSAPFFQFLVLYAWISLVMLRIAQ